MDDWTALRLQIEWGVDEALLDAPVDRFVAVPAGRAVPPPMLPSMRPAMPRAVAAPAVLRTKPVAAPAVAAADLADLAGLHAALDALHACPLRATASHTVAPSGNPAAGLVLIGEAPGPDDDRSGQAFSGAAGAMLDRVLASAGLGRDSLLLTHLVPWRPPGGRAPHDAEVAMCLPFLHRLLQITRPRHLVLLGERALRTLVGREASLRQARGRWVDVVVPGLEAAVPALPMQQPDRWLQGAASRQSTWADLLTLVAAFRTG